MYPYSNGVIDERLPAPDDDVSRSSPDWALQDPRTTCGRSRRRPAVLAEAGVDPADVIGIGIDFTACTMLPTTARRHALCVCSTTSAREPHAWVKLWKHHAAQPEADRINAVARGARRAVAPALRRQDLLRVVLRQGAADPRRGARDLRPRGPADRGGRLGRLAAHRRRDAATSAPPATRRCGRSADGFPADDYFAALDPRFEHVVDEKMSRALALDRRPGRRL